MAVSRISKIRLAGVAAAVPKAVRTEEDLLSILTKEEAAKSVAGTGVKRRHRSSSLCTSDLCHQAAISLLRELQWEPDSIEALVFVSQSPDYILPSTACVLHGRLGLKKEAMCFDISLGCSGYIYGLCTLMSLMSSSGLKRALLLVGDTASRLVSDQDRATYPLFGDAGTATALEFSPDAGDAVFQLGSDGSGYSHLIVPAGGMRCPRTPETAKRREREGGSRRSDEELSMNGPEVFAFTLREVPPLIAGIMANAKLAEPDVDHFVFHQANAFILRHLAKKMNLPEAKMAMNIAEYGNTSSASVPLLLATSLREPLRRGKLSLVLAGFGVGLSWGAAALSCGPISVPEIIEMEGAP